jgi:DNA-directed RNA polymerase omega subunit
MDDMSHLILPKEIDSKFRFITVASQRAKQLQNGAKPRVEARSRKPTRVAMQEVLANAVSWEFKEEAEKAPSAVAEESA